MHIVLSTALARLAAALVFDQAGAARVLVVDALSSSTRLEDLSPECDFTTLRDPAEWSPLAYGLRVRSIGPGWQHDGCLRRPVHGGKTEYG